MGLVTRTFEEEKGVKREDNGLNEAWDAKDLGVSVYLKSVCYRSKDVKRLENLKRQEVVVRGRETLGIKISEVEQLGVTITCRLWCWRLGMNVMNGKESNAVCK